MNTIIIGKESLLTKYLKIKEKNLSFFVTNKDDLVQIVDYINT